MAPLQLPYWAHVPAERLTGRYTHANTRTHRDRVKIRSIQEATQNLSSHDAITFRVSYSILVLATDSDLESVKPSFKCLLGVSGQKIYRQGLKYVKSDKFLEPQ